MEGVGQPWIWMKGWNIESEAQDGYFSKSANPAVGEYPRG